MLLAFEKGDLVKTRPAYRSAGLKTQNRPDHGFGIVIHSIPVQDNPYMVDVLWNNGKIERTLVGLLIKLNPHKEYL